MLFSVDTQVTVGMCKANLHNEHVERGIPNVACLLQAVEALEQLSHPAILCRKHGVLKSW